MKQKDYLIGRIVMVDPVQLNDPIQRPGEIGIVQYVSKELEDAVNVLFDDGHRDVYRIEHLKTLKPKKMLLDAIINHHERLARQGELKNMLLVYKLLEQGRIQESLKLAMENDSTFLYCICNCKSFREIKLEALDCLGKKRKRKI